MGPSNWEKASVIMSGLALAISVAMPIVGYYWLDPKLQELRHRPKLEVIKSSFYQPMREEFGVLVENKGVIPATGITVLFKSVSPWESPPSNVEIQPPSPYSTQVLDDSVVIHLERALGQNQRVSIKLVNVKADMDVWLYSDQGESKATIGISGSSPVPFDRRRFKNL